MRRNASTQTVGERKKRTHAQTHYTIEERIKAVSILAAMGGVHPDSREQIRQILGKDINTNTLSRWQREMKSEVVAIQPDIQPATLDVAQLVADTRAQLVVSLAGAAQKASKHLNQDSVINAMSGRDAAVVTGITSEKLLLMAGHDVHANELFKAIATECIGTSWDPYHLMEDLLIWLRHKKQSDQTTITIENRE